MLDRLQNPEILQDLNQELCAISTPNHQAITPNAPQKIRKSNEELCDLLGDAHLARPFSFNLESFYFLLHTLSKHYRVAFALSSHSLFYQAYLQLESQTNIIPLIPDFSVGVITEDSLQDAINKGADCFILPYLNEDILTQNPIECLPKNVLRIIDISYAVALNLPLCDADIFLLNGENLGLMRPFGILASKSASFYGIPPLYLEIQNLYSVFAKAILMRRDSLQKFPADLSKEFFYTLQAHLGQDCYYFYQTPPNTLALGLKDIRARNLIQSLIFDKIDLINGQECLFGFNQPSFVLRLMNYTEAQCRELLSLSFIHVPSNLIPQIAQKIAQKYTQVRELKI